jgi:hypothetical protein
LLLSREESGVISSLVLEDFEDIYERIEKMSPQIMAGYINCIDNAV